VSEDCHLDEVWLQCDTNIVMSAIDYFTFSVIIDDIVFHDGRTLMGVLGGGGPQTAFGMKLWATGGVGLCGGVGKDFPAEAQTWLDTLGIDSAGLRRDPAHNSLRAWQIIEADGRRTQVWRTQGATIPTHLALTPDQVPARYWSARGFHFGVHPESPNLRIMQTLQAHGIAVSVEPFREASRPLADAELRALLTSCAIFSPNLLEAETLVGGDPLTLMRRLTDAGASIVALRMGAEGSFVHRAVTGETHYIPAVKTTVVDPVGAGNAYCGALLVGWLETGDLRRAGLYASVAASFLVEQYGLPAPRPDLRDEAAQRLAQVDVRVVVGPKWTNRTPPAASPVAPTRRS
jgi:sugar/nucleoside kinase (ribokinase family)